MKCLEESCLWNIHWKTLVESQFFFGFSLILVSDEIASWNESITYLNNLVVHKKSRFLNMYEIRWITIQNCFSVHDFINPIQNSINFCNVKPFISAFYNPFGSKWAIQPIFGLKELSIWPYSPRWPYKSIVSKANFMTAILVWNEISRI